MSPALSTALEDGGSQAESSCFQYSVFSVLLKESVDLGEIMFSLCYLPTAGRLTLTVIKCRNLKAMDITGYSGGCWWLRAPCAAATIPPPPMRYLSGDMSPGAV